MKSMRFLGTCASCIVLWLAGSAAADDANWATKMFSETTHDFGIVARGADTHFVLRVTNKYQPDVHIADVKTSCGCTVAKPNRDLLHSHETADIDVKMNTVKFTHQKDSSVTVIFDAPQYAEVRVPVRAYIRPDVVLSPGEAEFGAVPEGDGAKRTLTLSYAGRPDWKITKVVPHQPYVNAEVRETGREGGRVTYQLLVTLKPDAPAGELRDSLTISTNDPNRPPIPVMVEGRIEPEYALASDVVSVGVLAPGQKKNVKLVVRAKHPFLIEKVADEAHKEMLQAQLPETAKAVQVVPVTIVAPDEPGPINEEGLVTISGTNHPLHFKVYGKVAAPSLSQGEPKPHSAARPVR